MKFTGGLPETACGYGSTLAATRSVRDELPALLARLGTKVLLDAPCGDLNWLTCVPFGDLGVKYVGVDICDTNLATARKNAPDLRLEKLDILADPLPPADTVLCRDFLQHLPTELAVRAILTLAAAPARWLLATSHDNPVNADIARVGDFRPLNLTLAPFLGPPAEAIPDGPGRILGVWRL